MDYSMGFKANYAFNGKIMLCSVITIFVVVFIVVCFHNYSKCCFHSHHRRIRRRRRARHLLHNSITPTTTDTTQGLDVSILKALPTFTYSSKTSNSPLECAVCLSEFEDEDQGRVLPKCEHTFHVECIDMWFQSHSNCPLCRASVQQYIPVTKPEIPAEPAGVPAESLPEPCQREEAEMGCSGFSRSVEGQRKPLELVGIVVDVPRLRLESHG